MKDRLITLFGGLVALYIVIALLTPPSQTEHISRPLTIDKEQHGLALLYEWLAKSNIPVHPLRQRYSDVMSLAEIPDSGNFMLINLPLKITARKGEMATLRRWIAQGNTALILVAHGDFPKWAPGNRNKLLYAKYPLLSSLGFNIVIDQKNVETSEDSDNSEDIISIYQALKKQTLTEAPLEAAGINNPEIKSLTVQRFPLEKMSWQLAPRESQRGSRVLLTDNNDTHSPAMWQLRIGTGNIIVSRYADLFSNHWLSHGDHARLFDHLLRQHRTDDGYVLFDDMHQGLTALYDPDAFYSDPRLHNTLWFLFGFWLLYLIGRSNRLGPPAASAKKIHAADFIRAIGGLFARRLSNATTALGLIQAFFNQVRQQYGLPLNSQPVWELLESTPRINKTRLATIQQAYNNALQNKKQNLIHLHNQLRETRESLL